MRPWEVLPPLPWTTAQPIFSRTVAVHRNKSVVTQGVGLTHYSGQEQTNLSNDPDPEGETVLFTNLPASIQMRSGGRTRGQYLASDIVVKPEWVIYIAASSISQYDIRDRDIIVDDESYRYGIGSNEWTPFGYQLDCIRLEL